MANKKTFSPGTRVKAIGGKHTGECGKVEYSDPKITTVRFAGISDPVWTNLLEVVGDGESC